MNNTRTLNTWTAALLILEGLLIFVPLLVLGAAIGWPASLGEPASVNLPLILEEAGAVKFGYFVYLIYSVLILPLAVLTARVIRRDQPESTILQMAVGFGVVSAAMRVLGIIRWLIPMPVLAQIYVDPASSEETRIAVSAMYDMLNAYAGSVGEVLGVGFFAALWVGLASVAILQTRTFPRWFGVYGIIVAITLTAGLAEIWNVDMGAFLTVNVTLLQFWFLIFGGLLLRPSMRNAQAPAAA
jgi:hypothetical protein